MVRWLSGWRCLLSLKTSVYYPDYTVEEENWLPQVFLWSPLKGHGTYTHGIKKFTVIKNKKWCFAICVCQSIFSFSILCVVFSSFFLLRLVNYLLKLLYCFVCFLPVTHPFLSLLCLTLPLPCLSFASVSLWAYTGLELILQPGLGVPSFERLSSS